MKLGLLENDQQWEATLAEASVSRTPKTLRGLFAIILKVCEVNNPVEIWNKFRNDLAEDSKHQVQLRNPERKIDFTNAIYNSALIEIEDQIVSMGGEPVDILGLPQTNRGALNSLETEVMRETSYDLMKLTRYIDENLPKLLPDQRHAYSTILESINNNRGGLYFLDAPGGTGKTFVTILILAKVRQQNKIALATASSGIAATLLPASRTAHSTFK